MILTGGAGVNVSSFASDPYRGDISFEVLEFKDISDRGRSSGKGRECTQSNEKSPTPVS